MPKKVLFGDEVHFYFDGYIFRWRRRMWFILKKLQYSAIFWFDRFVSFFFYVGPSDDSTHMQTSHLVIDHIDPMICKGIFGDLIKIPRSSSFRMVDIWSTSFSRTCLIHKQKVFFFLNLAFSLNSCTRRSTGTSLF